MVIAIYFKNPLLLNLVLASLQTSPERDPNPLFGNKAMEMFMEEATDENEETKQKRQILTTGSAQ